MSSRSQIFDQQRAWATGNGLTVDSRGYLGSFEANLRQPLSARANLAFRHGSGAELVDRKASPAKMRALHSSSALAVNVFDHWSERPLAPVCAALGMKRQADSFGFEEQFPTGLDGKPPNLDIALALAEEDIVGVESKFTEWLTPKSPNGAPFKEKYFQDHRLHWQSRGLPGCQALAEAMRDRLIRFRYLDAAQLLKHALGMANRRRGRFSLYYLFYEVPGREAELHRRELAEFDGRVGGELGLQWTTYQSLFTRLVQCPEAVESSYLAYLGQRYFPDLAALPPR